MRFLFLLLCASLVTAQQNATSSIEEVTVYLQGARITRTARVKVQKGTNEIVLKDLSADIDDSSIILTDLAGMSLTGINYSTSVLEKKAPTKLLDAINKRIDSVLNAKPIIDAEIAGLNEEKVLLQNNRNLNNSNTGLSLAQVKEFGSYYNSRIKKISIDLARLSKKRTQLNTLESLLILEKREINPQMNDLRGTITLKVSSNVSKTVNLELVYNVNGAGWVPIYDITAAGTDGNVELKFKGQVYQKSGTDWNDVKMTLSTGDPFIDNTKPQLRAKRLNFVRNGYRNTAVGRSNKKYNPNVSRVTGTVTDENGDPLLGVTVRSSGSGAITQTDFDGKFNIDARGSQQLVFSYVGHEQYNVPIYASIINHKMKASSNYLDEVVIQAYSTRGRSKSNIEIEDVDKDGYKSAPQVIAAVEENVASRTYVLSQPYSIPSTGETTDIVISENQLTATFEYYAAPVINENVFLTAQLKDWEALNLIPGEANIYFENAYTGKIYFDTDTTEDALIVSLGVDPQISVKREDVQDYKEKSFFGDKRIVNKRYEITVKNNRSKAIKLKLQDRIPMSAISDIKVDEEDPGDAAMDKETQILTWNIDLASGAQVKKLFSYQVKYPKKQRINLD